MDNVGYIFCEDNNSSYQSRWLDCYDKIYKSLGIKPHIISKPNEARQGYRYIWRPSHDNFNGIYKGTEKISIELANLGKMFEDKGAFITPTSSDLSFYENKKYICDKARAININIPFSIFIKDIIELNEVRSSIKFPLLLKHPYACSSFGMQLCEDEGLLDSMINKFLKSHGAVILQEYIKISKDLRINYVSDQAICNYWRVKSEDSISTATWTNSNPDFFSVPTKGIEFAIEIGRKFNMPFGGIDMVWRNDNLDDEPLLLEISPIFEPNPIPPYPLNWKNFKYGIWSQIPFMRKKTTRTWKILHHQIYMLVAAHQVNYLVYENRNQ